MELWVTSWSNVEGQQVADDWGERRLEIVYLPRTDDGRISTWQAALRSLAHQIRGIGEEYDARFEQSGSAVE